MKFSVLFVLALIVSVPCIAQFTSYQDLHAFKLPAGEYWYKQSWADSTYLFDQFQPGDIELKTGVTPTNRPFLNYNIFMETILIRQSEDGSIPLDPGAIHSVHIGNHKFIYTLDYGYMEIIMEGKISVGERTTMATNFVQSYSGTARTGVTRADSRTALSKFERYFWKEVDYFMFEARSRVHRASVAPLFKAFPGQKSKIKSFVKEHKTDFRKKQDVLDLVSYCNKEL